MNTNEIVARVCSCLIDHKIEYMRVNFSMFQYLWASLTDSELDCVTHTIDFSRSPAAYLLGIPLFISNEVTSGNFNYGIKKDNKISWSIPISINTSLEDLCKIIKLKNYW